jgi:hypothetical protein
VVFFIDFDQLVTPDGLIVVGLDVNNLSVWLNPTSFPLNGSSIPAEPIIEYQSQLGYSCSKVKIVYATMTQVNLILGCSAFYQQISIDLGSGAITPVMSFTKFSNCE